MVKASFLRVCPSERSTFSVRMLWLWGEWIGSNLQSVLHQQFQNWFCLNQTGTNTRTDCSLQSYVSVCGVPWSKATIFFFFFFKVKLLHFSFICPSCLHVLSSNLHIKKNEMSKWWGCFSAAEKCILSERVACCKKAILNVLWANCYHFKNAKLADGN